MSEDMRSDIAEAMSKMSTTLGSKREIKKLPEHLWEGERVDMITSGQYGSGTGIVVLSDRRLFFLREGRLSQTSEDFPLGKISSIQWSSGMMFGKIIVFASGNKSEITQVDKADGKAITDAVRGRLAETPQGSPSEPAADPEGTAEPDVYDQLRKLGELKDAGVLTSEEFDAKKAELLDRL